MDLELREEIDEIINDMRSYNEGKKAAQREVDSIDEEIADLNKQKHRHEDEIEGYEDDLESAEKRLLEIIREVTEAGEDPRELVRRAFG